MAILWQKKTDNIKYEIRTAGLTRRLYTNGVCHSEFNPNKIITGSVWDLLILPAFFYPTETIKRVLILGVGGGTSILLLDHLLHPDSITGIELNQTHLEIAHRFFKVNNDAATLIRADAVEWIQGYNGEPFDLIIDDLFSENKNEPLRAVKANHLWFKTLLSHLTPNGSIVMNFISNDEFNQNACFTNKTNQNSFKSMFRLSTPLLDNVIGVFLKIDADSKQLRKNIINNDFLNRALQSKKLRYRIRKINIDD